MNAPQELTKHTIIFWDIFYVFDHLKDESLKHKRSKRSVAWQYIYSSLFITVFLVSQSHVGLSKSDFQHREGKNASKQ